MNKNLATVAIVGRTNVGKSTLFNALSGKNQSIVEDLAGVTRDRSYALVTRGERIFRLMDTGGMLGEEEDEITVAVQEQTELALQEADLLIVVFDGMAGVHPDDQAVVHRIRSSGKPVVWVINKCEKPSIEADAVEFYQLGIEEYLPLSAAHRQGIGQLVAKIESVLENAPVEVTEEEPSIRVALVGKPNVGKSSLMNRFVGEKRMVTSAEPGTTRDSVDVVLTREGQRYTFVDTAGLRRRTKVEGESIEAAANQQSLRALARCDVAVLVLDATQGVPVDQDVRVAAMIHRRGIPLVLVVNKWDAVEKDHRTVKKFQDDVRQKLQFCQYAPLIFVSAETGRRCPKIFEEVKNVYEAAQIRVPTATLNKLLEHAFQSRPPKLSRGRIGKLFFATQIAVHPPTIVLFVNYPDDIQETYLRFLKRKLREEYPFSGTDIKLQLRKRRESSGKEKIEDVSEEQREEEGSIEEEHGVESSHT